MNLTDADKVWFEQQKQAVTDADKPRVVALNNDRDAFRLFLQRFASDAIIGRHEATGMLSTTSFEKPGFADVLLEFLAVSYHEILDEGSAGRRAGGAAAGWDAAQTNFSRQESQG